MVTKAQQRRVYLACRNVFTGDKALLRKKRKIQDEIARRPKAMASLIKDFGQEELTKILMGMLERRIFESDIRAKLEFPELFQVSPEQHAMREESELDAARSMSEALEDIAEAEDTEEVEVDGLVYEIKNSEDEATPAGAVLPPMPSLYPSFIPYKAQHLILNEAQRLLEESCFDFAQRWIPQLLEDKKCEAPCAIELTEWVRLLAHRVGKLPQGAIDQGELRAKEILFATSNLRHSAVHRLSTSARGIRDLIKSGVELASMLQDHARALQLEDFCREIDNSIQAMELNKNDLKNNTTTALQVLQKQREELDRQETEIFARMIKDDEENKGIIGSLLEDSVNRILNRGVENETALAEDTDLGADEQEDRTNEVVDSMQQNVEGQSELNGVGKVNDGPHLS
ncbi:hypothetical protein JX265_001306 [Neoarthrinium moseri]|uniref:Ubiquinol-cytochrome-c reductase cytochrome c1 n=1 Tax=Neoarthrinium moseri TaxID=1658444 RepID=A0A9Q0AVR6_9PEZI|nr:uncharacterized protein JN550_010756 [Neoarthrinium moseri]KAI1848975.1 hypothetical protein JX266_005403 [Neoarthrinium moseri]KAI1861686.1 hypothetical protein JN550_010756 [Neoarthrinium moseri]KAI1881066.1 hypothetical protein JX265_001306 [Neoarthrinium moseri]